MIHFINDSSLEPFVELKNAYLRAVSENQRLIEAISISSFNKSTNEVNSRYVNLKFIDNDKFIFFTNYNSPKSIEFNSHDQISAILYWQTINIQIRIKGHISKTSKKYNNAYFAKRSSDKNALAISSDQSKEIESYDDVRKKYYHIRKNNDLSKCPDYWGGFTISPYYFEFWEGHKSRLNKRIAYSLNSENWTSLILEP